MSFGVNRKTRAQRVPVELIDVLDSMISASGLRKKVKRTDLLGLLASDLKQGKVNVDLTKLGKKKGAFMSLGKRGSLINFLFISAMLVPFAIVVLSLSGLVDNITTELNNSNSAGNFSKDVMSDYSESYENHWDGIIAFIVIGGLISVVVTSFFIRIHPLFYIVGILAVPVMILLAANFANVYGEATDHDFIGDEADDFELTDLIFTSFPFLVSGTLIAVLIIQALRRGDG